MKDEKIAEMFAGYTAILATLVEALADNRCLDKYEFVEELYHLLEEAGAQKPGASYSAPIKHLISVIEEGQRY